MGTGLGRTRAFLRWLRPELLIAIAVLDYHIADALPTAHDDGLVLRSELLQSVGPFGPYAHVYQDETGFHAEDPSSHAPSMGRRGRTWDVEGIYHAEDFGLWYPCLTRLNHGIWIQPQNALQPSERAGIKAAFSEFVARGYYSRGYEPLANYPQLLLREGTQSWFVRPWGCLHDGAFAVVVMLAGLSVICRLRGVILRRTGGPWSTVARGTPSGPFLVDSAGGPQPGSDGTGMRGD